MSFPYKRILCPIDFDDNATTAIKEAGALARLLKAAVCVLHVIWINPLATEGYVLAELEESQSNAARAKMAEMTNRELAGVDYEINVIIGDPAEIVLATEKDLNADLIVMATHGRHGLTKLVLGSVAEKIVRDSTIPVLTIRNHHPD
jgi:nucleotide-binding universal stress UspA family protein